MTFLRPIAVQIIHGILVIPHKKRSFQVWYGSLHGSGTCVLQNCTIKNSSLVIFLSFESTSHWTLTQGQVLSSPFDSAILEPDFNLGFIQTQVSREIEPL